ncbi:MAG TPA: cell division protein FtsW [Flavobacteriales bacterium]|nr:cell division protein FtsW [Flavobacteriales bacterium]
MDKISLYFKGDRVIWMVVIILSLASVLAVYSSTGTLAYKYQSGNTEYYLLKHFMILFIGLLLMYGAHLIKYTYYSRLSQILIWIAVPMLVLTLLMGTNINQASRWLTLPVVGISFQTSDLAKLALIMFVARLLSKKQRQIKEFKTTFLPIIFPVILVCALILPANLSTAVILFLTCLLLMFIGRIKITYLLSLFGIGLVVLSIMVAIIMYTPSQGRIATWKNRIENFVSGENEGNYQVEQSKIAIAKGGFTGVGPGNSTQRNFLPHPYSDFIFAIIIEEYGLLGAMVLILLYLILLFRTIRIATRSPGAFATLLAMGCCFSLVFQAMINMAVAVNLFPVTGLPLPLVSMGGTSILFTSIAIGIILSVSKSARKIKMQEKYTKKNFALT